MLLSSISHAHLQDMVTQIEHALYNHKEWYRLLIRSLVCHLPCDEHDLLPESFKACRFGQWYYATLDKALLKHPRFVAIGKEHKQMHTLAKTLLTASDECSPISTYDYDAFANSLDRFQLEMFALRHELEELIYYQDSLTKAINRRYMLPMLQEQQELLKRQVHHATCLVMMDFDHFSKVNDTYVHAAGDRVLSSALHYIIQQLRPYDKVFRYGGEEFLLCLQGADLDGARELIERLRTGLSKLAINIGQNRTVNITALFGLTRLDPRLSIEHSIDRADKAVYAAKSAGRNCVKVA